MKNISIIILGMLAMILVFNYYPTLLYKMTRKRTVKYVQHQLKDKIEPSYQGYLTHTGINHPPDKVTLLALKAEKRLELWFEKADTARFIKTYPIQAASGEAGPKLQEGDRQVPEGFYKIVRLNPNSDYHLSLKVNYPNDFDQKIAQQEGRTRLGGEIYIHGKAVSIGCIAIGDAAIEEIFYIAAKVGPSKMQLLSLPQDFRTKSIPQQDKIWVSNLYAELKKAMQQYTHYID